MTDAYEKLVSKTDPDNPMTFGIPDLDYRLISNVPVNDPIDDSKAMGSDLNGG